MPDRVKNYLDKLCPIDNEVLISWSFKFFVNYLLTLSRAIFEFWGWNVLYKHSGIEQSLIFHLRESIESFKMYETF